MGMDNIFDAYWKEEVEKSSLSKEVADAVLDKEIKRSEISKCVRKLFKQQAWW